MLTTDISDIASLLLTETHEIEPYTPGVPAGHVRKLTIETIEGYLIEIRLFAGTARALEITQVVPRKQK